MHLIHIGFVLLFLKICDAKSLTFVIDTTFSMKDDIDETINVSKKILRSIVETNSSGIENFVLITFKDPDIFVVKITEDSNVFRSALYDLPRHIDGGGDCPEYSMTAIETALLKSKRESFIYVFTDASAKDYMRVDIVNQLVQKLQSRIIFVLTGTCSSRDRVDYQVYQQVAAISSGQVFHCKKNEVGKVLETVPILMNGDSSVLTSKYLRRGNTYFTFNVDDRTDDVTVSISGENVKILRVAGPDKKSLTSYTNLVNVDDTKIFKLKSPAPGAYTVLVYSDIRSTVVVNGKTLIDFQQGFSVFKPKSIKDTSRQPIKEQNTCLSVKIEDPDRTFELQKVQILTVHETLLKDISVIKNDDNFYVSEPFMPPNELFKICILGKDKVTGRPIRRIGKTFIEPQKPEVVPPKNKKPIVKIPEGTTIEVKYGSDVKISCQISAYPDPAVTWEDQSGTIVTNTATAVELPYDYVSYLKVDKIKKPAKHTCKAKNSEGSNFETVHLKIKANLEIVEKPIDQSIGIGKDGMLLCKVTSYPPATIKWYINNKEIRTDDKFSISPDKSQLMLKYVDDNHIGKYKCEVDNGVEKKVLEAKVYVTGMVAPKLDKTVTLIHSKLKKEIMLKCPVLQGKPEPTFSWHYKPKDSSKTISIGYVDKEIKVVAVMANDRARYTCSAKNYVGQDSVDFVIIVDRRPEFPPGIINKFQPEVGARVTLPCSVVGEPKPNIKWSRNGSQLANGNKYTIGPDNSLKFVAGKYDSSPNYECTASNKFGTEKYIAEVSVQTLPEISKEITTLTVPINNILTLQCKIIWGNPKPMVTWYIKGVPKKMLTVGDNLIQPITDINQAGIYYCEAKNSVGTDNHSINVIVEYPPRANKKESFVEVKQDAEAKLECEVYGLPKPKIQWIRNGYTISDSKYKLEDNVLRFPAQFQDNGAYYCIAYNTHGQLKYKVNLNVLAPAKIVNNPHDNPYVAIIGDYVLKVPCEVEGNPLPRIVWKHNEKVLVSDEEYALDSNMTITIKNPKANVNLTCFAENIYGKDIRTFQVIVNEFVNIIKDSEHIYLLKGENKHIKCPKKNSNDDERWYKNGEKSLTGEFHIKNASVFDDGNYTCRVSNMEGSKSYPLYIDVGWPPIPTYEDKGPIKFDGSDQLLRCDVDVKPYPIIQWWKNGELLKNANFETLSLDRWGNYKCFVQGVHGNFSRNFKVFAQDCFIKLDSDNVLMKPLMLRLDSTWLDNVEYKYNIIQNESMVKLTCPDKKISNYINQIKKSQVISQCKGGDQFDINGNIYKFSELKCTEALEPTMKETNETCLDKNSELIKVGFETLTEFVNVYDICIDKEKRIPLYTEMNLTSRQYTNKTTIKYKWTKDLSADVNYNYNYIYNCNTQRSKFRNIFRNLPKSCCLTKVQLVDPLNVYGPMQLTTFNYLNTVPIWNNCNEKSNWFYLENKIRNRAYMYFKGLMVWSGTSGVLQMADEFNVSRNIYLDDDNKIPVPLYLWKVLSDVEIGVPVVAVIFVNVPKLEGDAIDEYTKCKDISRTIEWMADIRNEIDQRGYVYSCHLNEFTTAFNISVSIFKVNEKYKDYSEY